jgi:hypothetical protein
MVPVTKMFTGSNGTRITKKHAQTPNTSLAMAVLVICVDFLGLVFQDEAQNL